MKIEQSIPTLSLPDAYGNIVELHKLTGPLVIYFYPKDETPGCTLEACEFRDRSNEFETLGAQVIGISRDSAESHQRFAKRHHLRFTLLSDLDGKAEKAFEVKRNLFGLLPGRTTYVFDAQLKLRFIFESAVQINKHVSEALKTLQKINKGS